MTPSTAVGPATADVVVAGGGPAGWSLAGACAERGLDVVLVDPRPDAAWRQTYGLWTHEAPSDLPDDVVAACGRGVVVAVRTHQLDDYYAVLDTVALRRHLHHPAVRVVPGRVTGVPAGPPGVVLDNGTHVRASVVADATGAAQALSCSGPGRKVAGIPRRDTPRTGRTGRRAEQTAYGVVVDRATAARVTDGRLLFMDWRPTHGAPGWPTFLYAVPLDAERVLLEETSLARRPGLPLAVLRARLEARLRAHGLGTSEIPADRTGDTERVRFPVDSPRHVPPPGVVAVGAATPLVHPASGYSLAATLGLAPRVAEAVARALGGRTAATAADAARAVTDSPAARVVHALRRRGLDVLLRMPPPDVPRFFDGFFAMPTRHQRAYLGAREDVAASVAAMTALFVRLPVRLRTHLVRGTLLGAGDAVE